MLKSLRLPDGLAARLERVAEVEGASTSVVIRRAVEQYCDAVLSTSARDRLADILGTVHSAGGRARRSGAAFRRLLRARRR